MLNWNIPLILICLFNFLSYQLKFTQTIIGPITNDQVKLDLLTFTRSIGAEIWYFKFCTEKLQAKVDWEIILQF